MGGGVHSIFRIFRLRELQPSSSCTLSPLFLPDLAADSCVNPTVFIVSIRRAKNDPFGKGTQVILGSTHCRPLCPFNALKEFLEASPPSPEPLFITEDTSPLLKEAFVSEVHMQISRDHWSEPLPLCWSRL